MSLNKWCMWPMDDLGNVCMGPVVARSTVDRGLLMCKKHAETTAHVERICDCSCDCLRKVPGSMIRGLCWPCWSDINDHGAVVHLDKQEHLRAIRESLPALEDSDA